MFFHNIRLYKVRIHLCCKKDAKFASGLDVQKLQNPHFFDLCKAHLVSQHLHIFQVIPISPPAGSTHVFVSFMRLPPSLLFAFSFHSFIVIVYVIISYYLIKSLTKILSHSRKNGNCDKQLQSSNLQDKDKSTPYKPKPVYSCRQTRSHYKVQTVKI